MTSRPSGKPFGIRELYTGEVYEYDFQMDAWRMILTSWGYPVEDRRFITCEEIWQKKQIPEKPHSCGDYYNVQTEADRLSARMGGFSPTIVKLT